MSLEEPESDAISLVDQGITMIAATDTRIITTYFQIIQADLYRRIGRIEESLDIIEQVLAYAEATGEEFFLAELFRLRGEVLLSLQETSKAEENLLRSIDIARHQQAKSLELRSTMSLGRLWRDQGRGLEALSMLQEIYGWFTEGFETPDLLEAKSLLDELSKEAESKKSMAV